jgi:hypothetical protein
MLTCRRRLSVLQPDQSIECWWERCQPGGSIAGIGLKDTGRRDGWTADVCRSRGGGERRTSGNNEKENAQILATLTHGPPTPFGLGAKEAECKPNIYLQEDKIT